MTNYPIGDADIIKAVCEFHTETATGAQTYPTLAAIAAGRISEDEVRDSLELRGRIVREACRLEQTATSLELGDPGRVPFVDGQTLIAWSDHLAGLNPGRTVSF
jgi:hypothetical protein